MNTKYILVYEDTTFSFFMAEYISILDLSALCPEQLSAEVYHHSPEKHIYFVEDNNLLIKIDAPRLSKQDVWLQSKNQTDRYIPLLHYVFKNCPSLSDKIDRARFSRKEIVKITKEYHYAMCTSNEDHANNPIAVHYFGSFGKCALITISRN